MLEVKVFAESVAEQIKDYLPTELQDMECRVTEQQKNNGVMRVGISCRMPGSRTEPLIYMESFYEMVQQGEPLDSIMEIIAQEMEASSKVRFTAGETHMESYDEAKAHLSVRLINTDANRRMLKDVPHKDMADLSAVCCVEIPLPNNGIGSIRITNSILERWGVGKDEVFECAIKNMQESNPPIMADMEAVLLGALSGTEKHRVSKESRQIKQRAGEEHPSVFGEAPASSAGRESPSYQPKEHMKRQAGTQRRTAQAGKFPGQAVKTAGRGGKTVKTTHKAGKTVKSTGKGTVKTAGKTVKTAERSAKTAIKTAEQTAKTAQAAAKASAKAAQKSAQASRAAAKAAATAIKAAIKATIAAVKAAIAGTKSLVSAIAAGGWVAVVVILLICMVGLLLGSSFGIFFSGESMESGQPAMQAVVAEINAEYQGKLDEVKNGTSYDVLEMSGVGAVWKEVLAVYAVKTNTDPDNPQEVATIDDGKKQLLKDIFWEMHTISSRTESVTETVTEESDDGHGNIVTTESTVTRTYLYITVSHKTADEMAEQYGFNEEQKAQLKELLSEEYAGLWSSVLYGISVGDGEIVAVAASQIGNVGGEPYWSWYGFGNRVEWCACFVSWCADQCGYIDTGVIPKFSLCTEGEAWFKDRGQWQDRSYTPGVGDIIFFDWDGDGETDHMGIVESVIDGRINGIEGNSGNEVRRNNYPIGSGEIYGYGIMAYRVCGSDVVM